MFLLRLNSLTSKAVFAIKFACANPALETSAGKVLNSGVINVFVMVVISKFIFKLTDFCVVVCFFN